MKSVTGLNVSTNDYDMLVGSAVSYEEDGGDLVVSFLEFMTPEYSVGTLTPETNFSISYDSDFFSEIAVDLDLSYDIETGYKGITDASGEPVTTLTDLNLPVQITLGEVFVDYKTFYDFLVESATDNDGSVCFGVITVNITDDYGGSYSEDIDWCFEVGALDEPYTAVTNISISSNGIVIGSDGVISQ